MSKKERQAAFSGSLRIHVALKNVVVPEKEREAARKGGPPHAISEDVAADQELTDSIHAISKGIFGLLTELGVPETAITIIYKGIKRVDLEAN